MPVLMSNTNAAIAEEKIYVLGCLDDLKTVIVLFNTTKNVWEPEILKPDIELHDERRSFDFLNQRVVMANKMYMREFSQTYVYDPKENIWRPDDMLRSIKLRSACVIDDMLYYYPDDYFYDVKYIKTYDLKRRCLGVVKGLKKLFSRMKKLQFEHTADYGGNLALFYSKGINYRRGRDVKCSMEHWCVEISLERRQGGEIWGKVEYCGQVLVGHRVVLNCLNVMV
ncbi:unnamed protein product [Eruca vesicaria subsp. sativa]|uniref:FKB95-like N-terminal Kelch domain-containing protein n=1 Tax=Eruca vesicaria subsp. sativa TaxID=29727 RepID=A0ABC8K9J4_ERUVS|nr:unnamed protein product [Eruca vesicaria subsp. sativa]